MISQPDPGPSPLIQSLPVDDLIARVGSPIAIFDVDAMVERFYAMVEAFSPMRAMICIDTQAVSNIHIIQRLAKRGAGLSISSAADLERAWLSGAPMARVISRGVGRSDDEIRASLDGLYSPMFQTGRLVEGRPPYYRGPIGCLSVSSREELAQIARITSGIRIACHTALRINLSASTSQPGFLPEEAPTLFTEFGSEARVRLSGLHCHPGPDAATTSGLAHIATRVVELATKLMEQGHRISLINLGGGMASNELQADAPTPADYAAVLEPLLTPLVEKGVKIAIEPGWALCAGSCALVARTIDVRNIRGNTCAVVDAAPHPALAHLKSPTTTPTPQLIDQLGQPCCAPHAQHLRVGQSVMWIGGGYRARSIRPQPAEILLSGRKICLVRPHPSVAEQLAPELESQEIAL